MSGAWTAAAVVGSSLVGGYMNKEATKDAAKTGAASTAAGIAAQQAQYDQTRADYQPYREAGSGVAQYGNQAKYYTALNDYSNQARDYKTKGLSDAQIVATIGEPPTEDAFDTGKITGYEGGALNKFISDMDKQPTLPTSAAFTGQAVNAPKLKAMNGSAAQAQNIRGVGHINNLANFNGQAVESPGLNRFNDRAAQSQNLTNQTGASNQQGVQFDPRTYMESDAAKMQMEMAQQAQDRLAGKNRQLGSGQRAIEAARYATKFTNDNMNDELSRQNLINQSGNMANQQNYINSFGNTQANNQNALNTFNMDQASANQGMNINRLNNQTAKDQFGLDTQTLNQGMSLNQLANQTQQQNIANRLTGTQLDNQAAGQRFGMESDRLAQNMALNQMQNQTAAQQFGLDSETLGQEQQLHNAEQQRLMTDYGLSQAQYQQMMQQNAGLIDLGAGAAGAVSQSGANSANNITNLLASNAQTQAATSIAGANSVNNLIGQGIQAYGLSQYGK